MIAYCQCRFKMRLFPSVLVGLMTLSVADGEPLREQIPPSFIGATLKLDLDASTVKVVSVTFGAEGCMMLRDRSRALDEVSKELKSLKVSNLRIGAWSSFCDIGEVLSLDSFRTSLHALEISSTQNLVYDSLPEMPALQHLTIGGSLIPSRHTPDTLFQLVPKCPNLQRLIFFDQDLEAVNWAKLLDATSVREVRFIRCKLSKSAIGHIAKHPKLRLIQLAADQLTPETVAEINATKCKVRVDECRYRDLPLVQQLNKVIELALLSAPNSLQAFPLSPPKFPFLEEIKIESTDQGDFIAANPSVARVTVQCALNDRLYGQLKEAPQISVLAIRGKANRLSVSLDQILGLRSLRTLSLNDTRVIRLPIRSQSVDRSSFTTLNLKSVRANRDGLEQIVLMESISKLSVSDLTLSDLLERRRPSVFGGNIKHLEIMIDPDTDQYSQPSLIESAVRAFPELRTVTCSVSLADLPRVHNIGRTQQLSPSRKK